MEAGRGCRNDRTHAKVQKCTQLASVPIARDTATPGTNLGRAALNPETSDDFFDPYNLATRMSQRSSGKMRELRVALALALGLAITCFGAAVVAANYIAK